MFGYLAGVSKLGFLIAEAHRVRVNWFSGFLADMMEDNGAVYAAAYVHGWFWFGGYAFAYHVY
jgi:hypothetical protein